MLNICFYSLDAQHFLWKMHTGYTLNPKIPINPDMKIAEIGTGTGYVIGVGFPDLEYNIIHAWMSNLIRG